MYDSSIPANEPASSAVVRIFNEWQAAQKAWLAAFELDEGSPETLRLSGEYLRLQDELWRAQPRTARDVAALAQAYWETYGPESDSAAQNPEAVALKALCDGAAAVAQQDTFMALFEHWRACRDAYNDSAASEADLKSRGAALDAALDAISARKAVSAQDLALKLIALSDLGQLPVFCRDDGFGPAVPEIAQEIVRIAGELNYCVQRKNT